MSGIHCGKTIKPGGRYDRFLALLRAVGLDGATTKDFYTRARIYAVSAVASELRAMGYEIECQPDGRSEEGAAVYRYWLRREPIKGSILNTAPEVEESRPYVPRPFSVPPPIQKDLF